MKSSSFFVHLPYQFGILLLTTFLTLFVPTRAVALSSTELIDDKIYEFLEPEVRQRLENFIDSESMQTAYFNNRHEFHQLHPNIHLTSSKPPDSLDSDQEREFAKEQALSNLWRLPNYENDLIPMATKVATKLREANMNNDHQQQIGEELNDTGKALILNLISFSDLNETYQWCQNFVTLFEPRSLRPGSNGTNNSIDSAVIWDPTNKKYAVRLRCQIDFDISGLVLRYVGKEVLLPHTLIAWLYKYLFTTGIQVAVLAYSNNLALERLIAQHHFNLPANHATEQDILPQQQFVNQRFHDYLSLRALPPSWHQLNLYLSSAAAVAAFVELGLPLTRINNLPAVGRESEKAYEKAWDFLATLKIEKTKNSIQQLNQLIFTTPVVSLAKADPSTWQRIADIFLQLLGKPELLESSAAAAKK
jgi:hypothetical protein